MQEKYLENIVNDNWVLKEINEHTLFTKIANELSEHYKDFKIRRDLIRLLGISRSSYSNNRSLYLIRFYLINKNKIEFMDLDEVIGNENQNIHFDLVKIRITNEYKPPQGNIEFVSKVVDSYTSYPIRKKAYNYYLKRTTSYTGITFRITDHIWHIPYTKNNRLKPNPPYLDYNVFVACNEMITKKVKAKNNLLERTILKMLEML